MDQAKNFLPMKNFSPEGMRLWEKIICPSHPAVFRLAA
jgi:hypothetical protein